MTNNSKKLLAHNLFLPVVVLLLGLTLTLFGAYGQFTASKLQQNGVVVNSLDIEGNTEVIMNGSHSLREIAPQFKTKEGEVHTCRARLNENMLADLNSIVEVRYLPENPKVCDIKGAKPNHSKKPIVLGLLMMLGSLLVLVSVLKKKG